MMYQKDLNTKFSGFEDLLMQVNDMISFSDRSRDVSLATNSRAKLVTFAYTTLIYCTAIPK